jgi:hypothetical protein
MPSRRAQLRRAAARRPVRGFVYAQGRQTLLDGAPFVMHGATVYGWGIDNRAALINLALQARLNMIEPVNFESTFHDLSTSMSESTWTRIDDLLDRCRTAGLKLLLNLSGYGHSLAAAGQKPATTDWGAFLTFVMNRVNTVNGRRYRDDNTIAKIEVYGEIEAPNYAEPMRSTTAETTAFFARTLRQLRALTSSHLISTGGFSYLDTENSGIDYQTIMADPYNQTCDVEINSFPDRDVAVPKVAAYAGQIGKPWFLAAFSSCQGAAGFTGDANHWADDAAMAGHLDDCYRIARAQGATAPAPTYPACGAHFWNLAQTAAATGNCDISPNYPLSFAKVQQWSPLPAPAGGLGTAPLGVGPLGG